MRRTLAFAALALVLARTDDVAGSYAYLFEK